MTWNLQWRICARVSVGLAASLLIIVNAAGCGPATAEVTGTVTIGDKPLSGGIINFVHADGKQGGHGVIDANGKYSVKAPLGECQVSIDNRNLIEGPPLVGSGGAAPKGDAGGGAPMIPNIPGKGPMPGKKDGPVMAPPDKIKEARDKAGAPPAEGPARAAGTYVAIPPKYYDKTTSGLTYTVKSGSNSFDVKLDSK